MRSKLFTRNRHDIIEVNEELALFSCRRAALHPRAIYISRLRMALESRFMSLQLDTTTKTKAPRLAIHTRSQPKRNTKHTSSVPEDASISFNFRSRMIPRLLHTARMNTISPRVEIRHVSPLSLRSRLFQVYVIHLGMWIQQNSLK